MPRDFTFAEAHAARLLAELGLPVPPMRGADHPALAWRRAGLMAITGRPDGPGRVCPAALASAADAALIALRGIVDRPDALPANGAILLGERARLMGLSRQGAASSNTLCRLLDCADGRIALNLPRPEDWELLPALLEEAGANDWPSLAAMLRARPAAAMVERGVLLGLAMALDAPPAAPMPIFTPLAQHGKAREGGPLVVELASLWAGPLAGSLLAMAGGRVVKVESATRPDGARGGHAGFFDLLNGGKASVALDFGSAEGRAALARLVAAADIVIEGSRPRALRQLGVDREAAVARGAIWIAISGHGGDAPDRTGFGDDAGVAAGLSWLMHGAWGDPLFAGDAIPDPLTGLYAALAGWAAWRAGAARLFDLSLRGVVAHAILAGSAGTAELRAWQVMAQVDESPLYPLRKVSTRARPLGADTDAVLATC
ncbi:MAG: acyl-CoA transferase/carnitine dehydratase-like protein [Bradyrhizobium sp.]|nr:acyl-CoA transferase/carnitine dehydratase-like protein [Bradyrhizobium sp.]